MQPAAPAKAPGQTFRSGIDNTDRLGTGQQLERALEVFQAIQQQGVVPDAITHDALITAGEKGQQPERAMEVFN